jgi:hypothetical protein
MTISTISQVALSNTFNEFRSTFNDAANVINESIIGGTGDISANNVVGTTLVGGSIRGTTLTSGRVALVGTNGVVGDDSGLTFDTAQNALTVQGTLTSGNVSTGGTLGVTGAATLSNTLSVTGTSTLLGTTTFGTGANNAVYYPANGSLILTSAGDASGTGRVDANHIHGEWHVGAGGDLEAWATSKGDNSNTHKVFGITTVDAAADMLIVNQSEGANAYAEFIAIHATGNTADGWVSMGVNSTNYDQGEFSITKADDAYVLYSAPVGTTESGDLVIGTSGNGTGNRIIFSADGFDDPANNTQLTIDPGQSVFIAINTQSSNTTTGALVVNGGIGLRGNLNVGGNVAITGTITLGGGGNTVSTSSLSVDNPIIFLGANNAADTFDLGIVGEYTSSGKKFAGLVRDASDSGIFKLFANNSSTPANTVNFSDANNTFGTLLLSTVRANGGTASSSNTTGTIIVTGGVGVAGRVHADVVHDSIGNLRAVPQNTQVGSYVLVATDVGKHISTNSGVTVNTGIFSPGDVVTIYNNSGSSITVTQGSSVTLRLAGTATTGNRTLAQRGLVTLLCVASGEFVASGSGVS